MSEPNSRLQTDSHKIHNNRFLLYLLGRVTISEKSAVDDGDAREECQDGGDDVDELQPIQPGGCIYLSRPSLLHIGKGGVGADR